MKKQCQSCGKPLKTKDAGDCRGTESDGLPSGKWCKWCYQNGAFVRAEYTLEEMKRCRLSLVGKKQRAFDALDGAKIVAPSGTLKKVLTNVGL